MAMDSSEWDRDAMLRQGHDLMVSAGLLAARVAACVAWLMPRRLFRLGLGLGRRLGQDAAGYAVGKEEAGCVAPPAMPSDQVVSTAAAVGMRRCAMLTRSSGSLRDGTLAAVLKQAMLQAHVEKCGAVVVWFALAADVRGGGL